MLVTGGGSGVGRALCAQLLDLGCEVLTCGRDPDRLATVAAELPGLRVVAADLATVEGRAAVVARVRSDLPRLSILINNAGVQEHVDWCGSEREGLAAATDREIATNFTAPLLLTGELIPLLAEADDAALVNVTSGLAIAPKRSAPVYCATKAALRTFTTALRYQTAVGAPSIVVNDAILPLVDTAMTAGRGKGKISPDQAAAAILAGVRDRRPVTTIGVVRVLRVIDRIAPSVAARIMRNR